MNGEQGESFLEEGGATVIAITAAALAAMTALVIAGDFVKQPHEGRCPPSQRLGCVECSERKSR